MDPPPPHLPQPPFFQLPTASITAPSAVPSAVSTQILPPAPQVTAEATSAAHNHIAHAVNATAPTAPQSLNHPSYTDMIYAAITALKERDGSSKRAIAKYIERVYTGLPPTHSALLTHHLKRLKNTGLLVMVKKSYKLPRSDDHDLNINNNINDNNNPNNNTTVANSPFPPNPNPAVASSASGPNKRGRGRPPKPKSGEAQPNASVMVPVGLSVTTKPTAATAQPNAAGKKRPGRPKKGAGGGVVGGGVAVVMGAKRRGRPPKSGPLGLKKSPGRPKKLKSVASNGVKKGPKRLPKSVVVPYATGGGAATRPRGRPKKGDAAATAAAAGVVVQGKRPGRPPKVMGGVVVKPKKRAGRPVGRPKKNAKMSWTATEASQSEAYGDLKRKFEFFQSKVGQAVGVLRPQLTNETPISIVAAIQELEGLAAMDINAPLVREEAQPQPPPPQAPPQAQPPHIQN